MTRRDPWAWAGIGVVGVTAIVWSFAALSDLARMVGVRDVIHTPWFDIHIAWGLPITVDVLAVVATRVWLRGIAPAAAIEFARRAAWGAIGASIAGNAYHGLIRGNFEWDALIVSAVPAVVIGAIVHLAVLVARPDTPDADELPQLEREADAPTPPADSLGGERGIATTSATTTPDEPTVDEPAPTNIVATPPRGIRLVKQPAPAPTDEALERLLAEGAGRKRIARELGITEHAARTLLDRRTVDA